MPGGQAISSGQGVVMTGQMRLTGQAIESATGTLFKDATTDVFVALRSRKSGTGTASQIIAGQGGAWLVGTVGHEEAFGLAGSAMTAAPGTMTYFGRATLTWNANSEGDLAGYRIWRGTASGVYDEIINVGNVTTYQVWELLPGFTHYFRLSAYDTASPANESDPFASVEVSKAF